MVTELFGEEGTVQRPLRTSSGWLHRVWPVAVAVTVGVVAWTSDVGLRLVVVEGQWARVVAAAYAGVMLVVAARPDNLAWHKVALLLAVVVWGGRALAFMDLVVGSGRFDLWGAVAERALIFVLVVTLHMWQVRRTALIAVLTAADGRGVN